MSGFIDITKNDLILILSYFDNIHDFGKLCTNKNKKICDYLYNYYEPKIKLILAKLDLLSSFKNLGFSTFDSNKEKFVETIISLINNNSSYKKINIKEMQNIIVTNFRLLFEGINDIETILNILEDTHDNIDRLEIKLYISLNEIITEEFWNFSYIQNLIFLQRQEIYYLIYFYNLNNKEKINELLNYFTTNEDYKNIIKINIKKYIKKLKKNMITFPITLFDDTNKDILNFDYINGIFKFKILNENKENIDAATVFSGKDFFTKKPKNNKQNSYQLIFTQNDNKIGLSYFDLYNNLDKHVIIICDYTYNVITSGTILIIQCTYNLDSKIMFYILGNNVGRKGKSDKSSKDEDKTGDDEDKTADDEDKTGEDEELINIKGLFQVTLNLVNYILTENDITKFIELKNGIEKFVDYDKTYNTMETILNYITSLKLTKEKASEIIVCLLFGAKRFGDWIQMKISNDNYFYLQTNDILCKLYGIIIGAPVLWLDNNYNITVYNYVINHSKIDVPTISFDYANISEIKNLKKVTSITKLIHRKYKDNMSITGFKPISKITNKQTLFNRTYYKKYIKYKTKYLQLKIKN